VARGPGPKTHLGEFAQGSGKWSKQPLAACGRQGLLLNVRTAKTFVNQEGLMAKKIKRATTSKTVASMSIDALFNLRDEVTEAISNRAADLRKQLENLTGTKTRGRKPGQRNKLRGKKIAAQFRSKKDPKLVWSGRGATPRWMKAEMKGTNLTKESFRIK
jgi:DNA-binding protein H-NS